MKEDNLTIIPNLFTRPPRTYMIDEEDAKKWFGICIGNIALSKSGRNVDKRWKGEF